MDDARKWLQPEVGHESPGGDPAYMTVEEDGQEAYDAMWADGDTPSPDGYLDRPKNS